MEREDLEVLKLTLENDLNRDTLRKILDIIRKITENLYNNENREKIIEIMVNDIEILKNYYKKIIDTISDLQ